MAKSTKQTRIKRLEEAMTRFSRAKGRYYNARDNMQQALASIVKSDGAEMCTLVVYGERTDLDSVEPDCEGLSEWPNLEENIWPDDDFTGEVTIVDQNGREFTRTQGERT